MREAAVKALSKLVFSKSSMTSKRKHEDVASGATIAKKEKLARKTMACTKEGPCVRRSKKLTQKELLKREDERKRMCRSCSSLDDYFADQEVPKYGVSMDYWDLNDLDIYCPPSPSEASVKKVEQWNCLPSPIPFLARWASDVSLSEPADEPITPQSAKTLSQYILQVMQDTLNEKRMGNGSWRTSSSQSADNSNVRSPKENADQLEKILALNERMKQKNKVEGEEEDGAEAKDEYFDED